MAALSTYRRRGRAMDRCTEMFDVVLCPMHVEMNIKAQFVRHRVEHTSRGRGKAVESD